ncbi:MAG: N-6 DNA methylase [Sulfurihydrogenibium sp.]|nr:N-6 DNA methylase [Sulfurihydrogenibium sp.]
MKKSKITGLSHKRLFGQHFTSEDIFNEFIFPEIKDCLYNYKFVDLFGGTGNLILPILGYIPEDKRIDYFKEHIFLFDIQRKIVEKAVKKAGDYGIPRKIALENIRCLDTLKNYPKFLLKGLPVYHITNPPYMYIGYIKKQAQECLEYFQGENKGYQDLYQVALANDLKHKIEKMIYIIPTNFIFSSSGANRIRDVFFKEYKVNKAVLFEKKIFEDTGVNVGIFFFERKSSVVAEDIKFEGLKIKDNDIKKRIYILKPSNHYRAGGEFDEFVKENRVKNPINVQFYLLADEVKQNKGEKKLIVIDANSYKNGYVKKEIKVNEYLYEKVKSNILYIRTVDSGSLDKRAGLYIIQEDFQADGILASKPYRTHPIQLFFDPPLPIETQYRLKDYFNKTLEYLREILDSEFMTTYKYSNSEYVRKYLGLLQAKKIIETFDIGMEDRI